MTNAPVAYLFDLFTHHLSLWVNPCLSWRRNTILTKKSDKPQNLWVFRYSDIMFGRHGRFVDFIVLIAARWNNWLTEGKGICFRRTTQRSSPSAGYAYCWWFSYYYLLSCVVLWIGIFWWKFGKIILDPNRISCANKSLNCLHKPLTLALLFFQACVVSNGNLRGFPTRCIRNVESCSHSKTRSTSCWRYAYYN